MMRAPSRGRSPEPDPAAAAAPAYPAPAPDTGSRRPSIFRGVPHHRPAGPRSGGSAPCGFDTRSCRHHLPSHHERRFYASGGRCFARRDATHLWLLAHGSPATHRSRVGDLLTPSRSDCSHRRGSTAFFLSRYDRPAKKRTDFLESLIDRFLVPRGILVATLGLLCWTIGYVVTAPPPGCQRPSPLWQWSTPPGSSYIRFCSLPIILYVFGTAIRLVLLRPDRFGYLGRASLHIESPRPSGGVYNYVSPGHLL